MLYALGLLQNGELVVRVSESCDVCVVIQNVVRYKMNRYDRGEGVEVRLGV